MEEPLGIVPLGPSGPNGPVPIDRHRTNRRATDRYEDPIAVEHPLPAIVDADQVDPVAQILGGYRGHRGGGARPGTDHIAAVLNSQADLAVGIESMAVSDDVPKPRGHLGLDPGGDGDLAGDLEPLGIAQRHIAAQSVEVQRLAPRAHRSG